MLGRPLADPRRRRPGLGDGKLLKTSVAKRVAAFPGQFAGRWRACQSRLCRAQTVGSLLGRWQLGLGRDLIGNGGAANLCGNALGRSDLATEVGLGGQILALDSGGRVWFR